MLFNLLKSKMPVPVRQRLRSFCMLCRLGLYRGWFAVICTLCISNFFYFYFFHYFKAIWLNGKQASSSHDLLAGFAAGKRHEILIETTHGTKVVFVFFNLTALQTRGSKCAADLSFVGGEH